MVVKKKQFDEFENNFWEYRDDFRKCYRSYTAGYCSDAVIYYLNTCTRGHYKAP